jgi:hypothetical protein
MILAIDPGLWKCGVAIFSPAGYLQVAYTARRPRNVYTIGAPAWLDMANQIQAPEPVSVLVVERMQIDRRSKNPAPLLELSGIAGALAYRFRYADVYSPSPSEWKGGTPKAIMKRRLMTKLHRDESERVDPRATHDAWDAIGLGAWFLGKHLQIERWRSHHG